MPVANKNEIHPGLHPEENSSRHGHMVEVMGIDSGLAGAAGHNVKQAVPHRIIQNPRWTANGANYYDVKLGPRDSGKQQKRAQTNPIW